MATPSANQYFEAIHTGPGDPTSPNLFTAAELVAGSFSSAAVSSATSTAVSTVNAAAPDSTSISQARSQAVSAATNASIADSKTVSNSANTSVADSKTQSNSLNISKADSKAVSAAFFAAAPSAIVSTADSKAVSVATFVGSPLPTDGRTTGTATGFLRSNTVRNVLDFGAIGDGVTDDYAAFLAAHDSLPITGGEIRVPTTSTNIYRLSHAFNLLKPVRLVGVLPSSAAADGATGITLLFDADRHGIIVNNYITIDETTRLRDDNLPGANYSIIDGFNIVSAGGATGLLNGGTALDCDGIKIRTVGVTIKNTWVQSFKRDNVSIRGSIGGAASSVSEIEGSPNTWYLENVTCLSAGRHNFYAHGADTNAGCSIRLNCTGAGQVNLYDDSFLGNLHLMPHCSTSGTMDYKSEGTVSANLFINPYSEGGDTRSSIMSPSMVIGGIFDLSAASTGVFIGPSGLMTRGELSHQNTLGAQSVGVNLGENDTLMRVLGFGSLDAGGYGEFGLIYDPTNKMWHIRNSGSASRDLISFPTSALVNGTDLPLTSAIMKHGVYLGGPLAGAGVPNFVSYNTAAPAAGGPYKKGDRVFNSNAAVGSPKGWICTVAGTPGTWVSEGNL